MKNTLLVSTAAAAILTAFVVSSAQEMPPGSKGDGAQNKGTPSSQQRPEGTNNRPEQGKGKQAQPKPAPDQRQQTTGQRDQDQREQGTGKQAQPKPTPDRNQRQTTDQRDQNQRQGKDKQAQPKPDQNRNQSQTQQQDRGPNQRPQTTGQGERDKDKAKQARPNPGAGPDQNSTPSDRAGRGDDRPTTSAEGRLHLDVEQRTRIRQTVFARSNIPRVTNVNFRIAVGTAVPTRVHVVTVPPVIVEYYPRFRNHLYFVVHDEIVIVDNRRRIVAVIPVDAASTGGAGSGGVAVAIDLTPDEIRRVQLVLIERGYELEADGVFGPNTRQALISFQHKQGWQATGRIDSRTVAELGVSVRSNEQSSTTDQRGGSGGQTGSGRPPAAAQSGSSESQPEQRDGQANREAPEERGTVGQGGSASSPVSPGNNGRNSPAKGKQPRANPVPTNPTPGSGGAASETSR
jgi:hypothetical protein